MKYLILLFPFFVFGQTLTIGGNGMVTPPQKVEILKRWNNLTGTFPTTQTGYSNTGQEIKDGAATFRLDVITNGVADRGRYNWMYSGSGAIPNSNTYSPSTVWSPCGTCKQNIHYAAWEAYLNDDTALALAVWGELYAVASDDNLDYSNGGSARSGGEPPRNNPTHGTATRYVYTGQANNDSHPFFILASKMEQYLHTYGIIYDLIKNDATFQSQEQFVNWWFKDYADLMYDNCQNRFDQYLGPKSTWQNFSNDWRNSSPYSGAGNNQTHAYFNSSGSTGFYRIGTLQSGSWSNRMWDKIAYVGAFGTYFNDATYQTWAFDAFKGFLQTGVFADGTPSEWYRSYGGPNLSEVTKGMDYISTTMMHITAMAHNHAVAVYNGFPGVTDLGKFYDYSTSEGTDERCTAYAAASTSGGNKSILSVLKHVRLYYLSGANGGYADNRYNENGYAYNLTSSGRNMTRPLPAAMANQYYNDQDLKDWYLMETSLGYRQADTDVSAQNFRPSDMGESWGKAGAMGASFGQGLLEGITFSTQAPPAGRLRTARLGDKNIRIKSAGNINKILIGN